MLRALEIPSTAVISASRSSTVYFFETEQRTERIKNLFNFPKIDETDGFEYGK